MFFFSLCESLGFEGSQGSRVFFSPSLVQVSIVCFIRGLGCPRRCQGMIVFGSDRCEILWLKVVAKLARGMDGGTVRGGVAKGVQVVSRLRILAAR